MQALWLGMGMLIGGLVIGVVLWAMIGTAHRNVRRYAEIAATINHMQGDILDQVAYLVEEGVITFADEEVEGSVRGKLNDLADFGDDLRAAGVDV
jgi:hypothetical protein